MSSKTDWYPYQLASLIAWHANFSTQAADSGTSHGLTAAQVTQIAADATFVTQIVDKLEIVDDYRQAMTAYKEAAFHGTIGSTLPEVPASPTEIIPPGGAAAGIEARTRLYAAAIKASAGYTASVGELYGIVAPAAAPPSAPSIRATNSPAGTSQVVLSLFKDGFQVVAVEMRRGGGAWSQIGVSQTAEFVDATPPATPGQPEQREYRVQGIVKNARSGAYSAVVSAVTVP